MATTFIDLLCHEVRCGSGPNRAGRNAILRSVADTLGVAAAGSAHDAALVAVEAYAGSGATSWSGHGCESREAAILANGIAAHLLDFDDVHLGSSTHPSVVLLPAVLTGPDAIEDDDLVAALYSGLVAAQAVADLLGAGHYQRGWHGTGTIGVFAATATVARAMPLDDRELRSAFALAAAMSGGLQANFGTGAKPAQAGFAAAAGYRAVRLARAGLEGPEDVFTSGFADLYGASDGLAATGRAPDVEAWRLAPESIAIKLFPCCYAAARLVGVVLDARRDRGDVLSDPSLTVRLTVPKDSIEVLRYDSPRTGAEAKFSAHYCVAAALLDGPLSMSHFEGPPSARPDILAAMGRVSVVEDEAQASGGDITFGTVALDVFKDGETIGGWVRRAIPGTPEDPPDPATFRAKMEGCLDLWERNRGGSYPGLSLLTADSEVRRWLP